MSLGMNFARKIDFNAKLAPASQMKALYAGTIAARLVASRSKEEFRETFTRDLPGWVTLFYVASIVEKTIGYVLDKFSPASQKEGAFSLIKGPEGKNFFKMLNPFGKHSVRSFEDIEAIKKVADKVNLKELSRNKAIVNLIGFIAPIAVLGLAIPWLNVQITRKEVLAAQGGEGKKLNVQGGHGHVSFSSNVNMTPDQSFKGNKTPFSKFV